MEHSPRNRTFLHQRSGQDPPIAVEKPESAGKMRPPTQWKGSDTPGRSIRSGREERRTRRPAAPRIANPVPLVGQHRDRAVVVGAGPATDRLVLQGERVVPGTQTGDQEGPAHPGS